jgi:hypothetical protein
MTSVISMKMLLSWTIRTNAFGSLALTNCGRKAKKKRYLRVWNATALVCSRAASPVIAATMCGTIPIVHPTAAMTLARAPRERPAAIV